jgi:hypothetical protein
MTLQLPFAPPPSGELMVAYGGGVNTVAMLVLLHRQRRRPRAIVMADPGSEWSQTEWYRDTIMQPWLESVGFPPVTVVSVKSEAAYRPRAAKTAHGTLLEECMRIKALPSIAYGWKKCSQKYKGRPSRWWVERQPWAQEIWARGERIIKCIGYDSDETDRAIAAFQEADEARQYVPHYPLLEAGYDREHCEELILSALPSLPHKSACRFCPSNQIEEWVELRETDAAGFAEALALEANAEIDVPDVVGLMRCMPNGRRQLRVWNGETAGAREQLRECGGECHT